MTQLQYESMAKTQVLCRFKGVDLKRAREAENLSFYMLSKALGMYPAKLQQWEKQTFVTIDEHQMRALIAAIQCKSKRKHL